MSRLMKKSRDSARQTKKSSKKQERRRRRQRGSTIDRRKKRNKMRDSGSKSRRSREKSSRPTNVRSSCTKTSSFHTNWYQWCLKLSDLIQLLEIYHLPLLVKRFKSKCTTETLMLFMNGRWRHFRTNLKRSRIWWTSIKKEELLPKMIHKIHLKWLKSRFNLAKPTTDLKD